MNEQIHDVAKFTGPRFAAVPIIVFEDLSLRLHERFFLAYCYKYRSLDGGLALPSVRVMADELSVSRHTIRRWKNALRREGWLQAEKQKTSP